MRTASILVVLASAPIARAQAPRVRLCLEALPPTALRAVRFELETRGFSVLRCNTAGPAAWQVGLEADTPLADVWLWAQGQDSTERRRVRVQGPLDTIDRRALAIAVASLLEEQAPDGLPVPSENPEGNVSSNEANSNEANSNEANPNAANSNEANTNPNEANANDGSIGSPEEPGVVRSSRNLMLRHVVALTALGAQHSGDHYGGGVMALYGLHLSPRFRMDFAADFTAGERLVVGAHLGFMGVIELARTQRWIEVGANVRYEMRFDRNDADRRFAAVGVAGALGFQQRIYRGIRFYLRGEVAPLYRLDSDDAATPGNVGSSLHSSVRIGAGILIRR
ncbi:MAG: hypothetical protein AAGE52_23845 [Myxococcota bacterium]